jgi:hypothetical protein
VKVTRCSNQNNIALKQTDNRFQSTMWKVLVVVSNHNESICPATKLSCALLVWLKGYSFSACHKVSICTATIMSCALLMELDQ